MRTIANAQFDVAALRSRCAGAVCGPEDEGYDRARAPWSVATDQRPPARAFAADAPHVACVIAAAREVDLRIAVQGTGHAAPTLGDLSGSVLVRTSALTEVRIDPANRVARVGAGTLWQDVAPAAAEHGLAPLAGSSPTVGVVGYTLGGGIGYLARRHGLACNHVTAVELVRLDGKPVRVDRNREPELFWALRGGGGRFGIVTALEFQLEPVPELYAGALFWPWERAPEVLEAWRKLTSRAPRELTSMWRLLQLPAFPSVPQPLRGRQMVNVQLAFLGGAEDGARLIAGLRSLGPAMDFVAPMLPQGLMRLHGDPEAPTPALTDHALLDALPEEAAHVLLAVAGPGTGSPLMNVELRHLGGALAEAPDDAGAMARMDGAYALHTVGVPATPDIAAAIAERNASLRASLEPFGSGRAYLNFAGGPVHSAAAFDDAGRDRIEALCARLDPSRAMHTGYVTA